MQAVRYGPDRAEPGLRGKGICPGTDIPGVTEWNKRPGPTRESVKIIKKTFLNSKQRNEDIAKNMSKMTRLFVLMMKNMVLTYVTKRTKYVMTTYTGHKIHRAGVCSFSLKRSQKGCPEGFAEIPSDRRTKR